MDRLRQQIDDLQPWQRNALMALVGVIFLLLVAVVMVFTGNQQTTSTTTSTSAPMTTTTLPATTSPPQTTSTTVAVSTTTPESTTTTTAPEVLELRVDGLRNSTFGDPESKAETDLVELLGPPDEDTGWVDQSENYGTCLGTEVRFVRWGALQVFFTDGPSDWAPAGVKHLASWTESIFFDESGGIGMTPEGIGVGSTVDDVIGAYGSSARIEDDPLFGPSFLVDTTGAGFLLGYLTGLESTDTVQSLTAGFACGE